MAIAELLGSFRIAHVRPQEETSLDIALKKVAALVPDGQWRKAEYYPYSLKLPDLMFGINGKLYPCARDYVHPEMPLDVE